MNQDASGKFLKGHTLSKGKGRITEAVHAAEVPVHPRPAIVRKCHQELERISLPALRVLKAQLKHTNPKIAQDAAKAILSKVLPERSANETWKVGSPKDKDNKLLAEFMKWKIGQDVAKTAKEAREKGEMPKVVKVGE